MKAIRVAAHVHSSWSYDGEWSLANLARAFRRLRCDVVLMAEHDRGFDQQRWTEYQRACVETSTDDILLVPGIEYSDPDNVVHVLVWGDGIPFLGEGRETLDVLRAAHDAGAVGVFAHPWRRNAVSRYRPTWAPLLSAVEIWNRKYDGIAPDPQAKAFADREGLMSFVSLDFHTGRQLFPLALAASSGMARSPAGVVNALSSGAFRPEMLNIPAVRFTRGIEGTIVRALEAVRRSVRGLVRQLESRVWR